MVKPHFHSKVSETLGKDFSELLCEVAPFVGPRIDVYQTKDTFFISVDLAGAGRNDFSLKLQKNTLCIEGVIPAAFDQKKTKVITSERFYGSFQRKVYIPAECLLEQLKAVYENGILIITIPLNDSKNIGEEV